MKDVVFDIGNVLLRWNPRYLYRKVFADAARMEHFLREACPMSFILELDGHADFAGPIERRVAAFPEFARELRMFDTRWLETLDGPIAANLRIVEALRSAKRPVYALTNYPAQKFEISRRVYPFLDRFDTIVVSGREGVTKPDPRIFDLLFARSGRKPQDLIFVDDSVRNVETSERLGMEAILYTDGLDLAPDLKARGALA